MSMRHLSPILGRVPAIPADPGLLAGRPLRPTKSSIPQSPASSGTSQPAVRSGRRISSSAERPLNEEILGQPHGISERHRTLMLVRYGVPVLDEDDPAVQDAVSILRFDEYLGQPR